MNTDAIVKAVALTSAGLFAGYTWALSDAAVPAVLLAPEPVAAKQWRLQYLKGFYISRPMCLINALSFGYLASRAPPASTIRYLYIFAAITTASGVPYALTLLRRTNGALSIHSDRLAGPGTGEIALTYAFNDVGSRKRETEWSTNDMIRQWQWHNGIRTWILVIGVVLGALGVGMDEK